MAHAMMAANPGSIILAAADLLALSTCIGILGFRIWVIRFKDELPPPSTAAVVPLWWLVGICLAVLTLSSVGELIRRTVEMSGRPLAEVGLVLPQVLSQTHFGRVWLLRPVALLVLWSGWRTRPRLGSPAITAVMLAAASLIAASRSLSGHAADWGDITLPELVDWSHLLAVSLWGGSLIGLTLTGFRSLTEAADERRQFVAAMVRRWSTLAGVALTVVALTGIYNAWLELEHFEAFWQTAYGRILLLKLSLVLIIVVLGASNRYLGIPSLLAWAGGSPGSAKPSGLLATTLSFLTLERRRAGKHGPLERFVRRAKVEGVLMIGALLCVTILLGQMPARHQSRVPASHHTHAKGMAR
ncbi:CopD family protein (plasmid) [Cupriavidus sp. KK10]|jgi:putative copper export protein|uniref:copper resistance D family protein n=1 Tax=Cupriavidus sp. KK10 TaxID=1478019 RepID=UPI001BAC2EA1|nr:CopD family protein [Cupriavidus sp. KK10]QUN31695.1 CopD family protein [Cupriavidus sp. KK10]